MSLAGWLMFDHVPTRCHCCGIATKALHALETGLTPGDILAATGCYWRTLQVSPHPSESTVSAANTGRVYLKRSLKFHLAVSAGLLLGVTPIYALVELFVLRMDPVVSLRARLLVALLVLMGLGMAFAFLRERSKQLFRIDDTVSSNLTISIHDLVFLFAFNATLTPLMYLVSGASLREILLGTGFALLMAVFNGPLNGFLVDLSGDLTGFKPSARLPDFIRNQSARRKQLIFASIICVVFLVLAIIYMWLIFF